MLAVPRIRRAASQLLPSLRVITQWRHLINDTLPTCAASLFKSWEIIKACLNLTLAFFLPLKQVVSMGKVEEPGLPLQGPQTVQQTNKSKKWTSLVKLSVLACVAYLFASKMPGIFERQELGHHRGGHSGPHRPHHGHGLWGHRAEKLFL